MPKRNPTDLLTLREVADLLGISYETAKKWRQKGLIPAPAVYVTRRHQRWDRRDIERIGQTERDKNGTGNEEADYVG